MAHGGTHRLRLLLLLLVLVQLLLPLLCYISFTH
jgi:hypothetical protein